MSRALDYKDISLVPRVVSTLRSRSEANTGIDCFGTHLDIPMIASPMPDVCDGKMAATLASYGALGIIHRFMSVQDEVCEFQIARKELNTLSQVNDKYADNIACAIGATGDYQERFKALYEIGCRIFCVDTANGANVQVADAIKWIRDESRIREFEKQMIIKYEGATVYLIAGNVASGEGYRYMSTLGVDAVRVGIAGGSVCETRTETGIWVPMFTAIQECEEERLELAYVKAYGDVRKFRALSLLQREDLLHDTKFVQELNTLPLIIADGGIKTPADLAKIIAAGADLVFCGSVFAGTTESPGEVIDVDGKYFKRYRGAASFSVQSEYSKKQPDYVEGRSSLTPFKGSVAEVIKRFKGGLASSMSYMNARNLDEFRENASFIEL